MNESSQLPIAPKAAPWIGSDRKPPQFYRGLRMKTDTHLHEQLEGMITGLVSPAAWADRRTRVLDLGCGEGALSRRLFDLGYEVLAADREAAQFRAAGAEFVPLDLDDPAATDRFVRQHQGRFDLIVAVEVIEHLRRPWDFVAACARLCGPATHLILTTPNVGSWWSRLWFLLTGDLWGFGPESWDDPGHKSPLPAATMRGMLRENGLECVGVTAAGCLPILWTYNWKRLLASLAMLPLRCLMRGDKDGWVLCYHAKRTA
jgi:2-polyprenyl-6-hydroxyphenyl methylase/3-demethylubiquinone-9 3-methyltransferase